MGFVAARNQIHGTIPTELGDLKSLEVLDVGANKELSGTIPEAFAKSRKMHRFDIADTSVTGEVPTGMCDAPLLSITASCEFLGGKDCSCCADCVPEK